MNHVLSCLRQLQIEIASAMMNGQTVELNQLGNFIPYLLAKPKNTLEKVDTSTIKRTRVNFVPNKLFKNKLKSSGYE